MLSAVKKPALNERTIKRKKTYYTLFHNSNSVALLVMHRQDLHQDIYALVFVLHNSTFVRRFHCMYRSYLQVEIRKKQIINLHDMAYYIGDRTLTAWRMEHHKNGQGRYQNNVNDIPAFHKNIVLEVRHRNKEHMGQDGISLTG